MISDPAEIQGRRFTPAAFFFGRIGAAAAALTLNCALTCALGLQCAPAAAQSHVMGVAGPMSGPLREAGAAMLAGVRSAMVQQGKKPGAQWQILAADDNGSQAGAAAAAQKLIAARAKIVIGHFATAPSLAAAPLYAKAGIVMIAPTASTPKLTDGGLWNVIRLAAGDEDAAVFAARDLNARYAGAFAIMHDSAAFPARLAALAAQGKSQTFALAKGAKSLPATIPVSTRAILWTGQPQDALHLLALLRTRTPAPEVYSHGPLAAPDFALAAGESARDIRVLLPASLLLETPAALAKLWSAGKVQDMHTALLAHAAAQIAFAAMSEGEGRAMAAKIRSGVPFETVAGAIAFDAAGAPAKPAFVWRRWIMAEDGKPALAPLPQ
ncbi:MAG: hypothetical protein FJX29_05790 [Alphaproteobacteria bacterium]|nr:hypothetical protein [Alphaproteobacteria bacterium]